MSERAPLWRPPASGRSTMTDRFTDAMWAEVAPTYRAILDLPFNREFAAD